jgi:cell wall-associated NlpC family hydrolase
VTNGRKRAARALAALAIAALGGATLTASPSTAQPSIGDVQDRVDTLYHEAEQASERYNEARIELHAAQQRLQAVRTHLRRQRHAVHAVRDQVVAGVVAEYQGQGGLSSASQVLLAGDPETFISQMTTLSEYNARQAGIVDELSVQVSRLQVRQRAAQRELDSIDRNRAELAREKAAIARRMSEAKALLGRLKDEREQRVSRSGTRVPVSSAPGSGRAAAAVSYALAQVGKPYVYGAAGPSAFDCSGLTMASWAQAGVALPHSSSAQMGSGTPVSLSALQPGDLVFYYSPVSHVGIYIGNGMIVNAENPSVGVREAPVNSMPISGAVRPG